MLEERLIQNWIYISRIIKNDRFVSNMPYSEALILFLVRANYPEYIRVQNIIAKSKMLKSQVNRTMDSLEKKHWIEKRKCFDDQRCQEIRLTQKGNVIIGELHESILEISKDIISILGEEDATRLNQIFEKIIAYKRNEK